VFCCAGNAAEGLAEIERWLQLSPSYPVNHTGHLSNALRLLGRYDEAAAVRWSGDRPLAIRVEWYYIALITGSSLGADDWED